MPKKFTYWRNSVFCEVFEVEAETEEEAIDKLSNGLVDPVLTEWIDWDTDHFELEHFKELDPLYRMIKDYRCDTTS
jgi:hypothetical protein